MVMKDIDETKVTTLVGLRKTVLFVIGVFILILLLLC